MGIRPSRRAARGCWWIRKCWLRPASQLSDEESSRRERQRTAALSGILEYSFAPSGDAVLFPLDGRLYYYDLAEPASSALAHIAHRQGLCDRCDDLAAGPICRRTFAIRIYSLTISPPGMETALTHDGGGPIKNGMAEFVAQEEMDRQHRLLVGAGRHAISPSRASMRPRSRCRSASRSRRTNVSTFDAALPGRRRTQCVDSPRSRRSR